MFNELYQGFYNLIQDLAKSDVSLSEALANSQVNNPKHSPEDLPDHLSKDILTGVGNLYAFNNFKHHFGHKGIHLVFDSNSHSNINKEHGFKVGDEAIKSLFTVIKDVADKQGMKVFRTHGDEGHLHTDSTEKADNFVKEVSKKLDSIPLVSGKHKLSLSIGLGYTPEHAQQALFNAKKQLSQDINGQPHRYNLPGEEKTVFHSLLHETPPSHWRPEMGEAKDETLMGDSVLKLTNPLK